MNKPIVNQEELSGGYILATIWQQIEGDVGEPALAVRSYGGGIIEVRQEDRVININSETIPALTKLLKQFSAK